MSKRYKAKRRARYYVQRKICQVCGAPGEVYTLEDFIDNTTVSVEAFCGEHARRAGFCRGCGQFWGGICSFEMRRSGLCDHCQDQVNADFHSSGEDEEDYYWTEDEPYCVTCNNTGSVNCYCGGDLCVCENNGESPCPSCDRGF